jgi:signal transduction histidine kinase
VALNQDRSPEEYRELLGSIVEECTRLGNLVGQLLLLAESDAGRLQRADAPVRLDALVLKAIDMFQGVADTRNVKLMAAATEEVWVSGDAGHLRQVVFNLIDNAIKFTPAGSVTVAVRQDEITRRALLTVQDTGTGIDPQHLPHVFERFYRGDRSRTRSERCGSGVGLSICEALVTAHGGTIRIESVVGQGTRVSVALPLLPARKEG